MLLVGDFHCCAHVSGDHRRWPGVLQWYQIQSILGPSLPTQLALARRWSRCPLPSSEVHTSSVHILLPDRSDPPATTSARRRRDGIHSQRHLRVGERQRRQIGIRISGGARRGAATRRLGVYISGYDNSIGGLHQPLRFGGVNLSELFSIAHTYSFLCSHRFLAQGCGTIVSV